MNRIPVFIIVAACILTRLPQLLDPNLMLDGDESVVALMAKHAYLGKELPIYFWGQTYGFSLIEMLAILPFYLFIGVSTLSVKLGMLSLWTAGVVLLYKAMVALNHENKTLALLLALIIVACPAWMTWSMKARGGYLTAFTLSSLTLYLLFYSKPINEYLRYILLAVLVCLIYESQPFWLTGVIPAIVFSLTKRKNIKQIVVSLLVASAFYLGLYLFKQSISGIYPGLIPYLSFDIIIQRIERFPEYLFKAVQGNYMFNWYEPTNAYYNSFANIFTKIFYTIGILGLLHLLFYRKGFGLFIAITTFIPLTVLYSTIPERMEGRYLLPVTAFTFFAAYIYINRLRLLVPMQLAAAYMVIAGVITTQLFPAKHKGKDNKREFVKKIEYLKKHNVKYAYATDCMMPWSVMFYSDEAIRCRMFYFPGRYPTYDTMVDKALYSGKKTAIIGYRNEFADMDLNIDSQNYYFISLYPTKATLEKAFQFPLSRNIVE